LTPGELFLLKLKSPDHFIAGDGLYVSANAYPTSLAWAAFGEGNGVGSLEELRERIGRLSRRFRRHSIRREIPRSDAAFY
jgi:putative restriction endonuclease